MSRRRQQQRNRQRRPATRTPAGTTTKALPPAVYQGNQTGRPQGVPFAQLLNQLTAGNTYGTMQTMPRDSLDSVPFGPINPLRPAPISPSRPDTGRPEPRIREYPPGWNIPGNDNRLIPWDVLYNAADQVDIMRRCIEVRKRHVRSLKWCFNVSTDAISAAYRDDPRFGRDDLEARLRDKYWPDIARLTEFWTKPWKTNGLNLGQWVNAIQDQHLVLDAVAIYPRTTYGGDVFALEILDGSTIKPLIDWRGDRPTPPYPAFQQEIYGFPRGEYTATTTVDEFGNEIIDGGLLADQLYYWREVFRPRSFYGFSAVEQALMAARLYVKRQGWMLSEYDDGSTPMTWLVPDSADAVELDPRQRTEWERAINDDLSGQTAARHRIKLSYPGFKPDMMPSVDERYKPEYDIFLIKLLAAHFGVPITELGFSEAKGLGTSGYHEGQEDVMDRVGRRPDIAVIEEIVNDISHSWLKAPPEIQFNFLGLESEDEAAQDAVADQRVRGARMVLNEDRKRQGLPLYDFPEADMPMVITQRGVIFLEGASQLAPPGELVAPAQAPPDTSPPEGTDADPDNPDDDEEGDNTEPGTAPPTSSGAAGRGPNGKPGKTKPKASSKPAAGTAATGKAAGPDVVKAPDPTTAIAESDSTRQRVHDQLAEDFPESSMKWLKAAVWSGPESVPTADIDYSNSDTWAAASEPGKVDKFTEKITAGKLKPIILVNTPDARKYIVIDGHHRAMAYRKLGIPAMAYIGRVAAKTGPWDQMHASQHTGDSGPGAGKTSKTTVTTTVPAQLATVPSLTIGVPESAAGEAAAFRRWLRKTPARGRSRPFTFEQLGPDDAVKAGLISFEDIGVLASFSSVKAGGGGGGDPKAPASAKQWPGWERDLQTAAHYSSRLRAMLSDRIDAKVIASKWATARDLATKTITPQAADAAAWLATLGTTAALHLILEDVLHDVYTEGYLIGDRAAAALRLATAVDWAGWTPGDPEAASKILGDDGMGAGLEQLLANSATTITSLGQGRLDELAQALALALENGDTEDTLATDLASILDDASWADMVATTELTRAVSAASLDSYRAGGIEAVEWLTAGDGRVCAICDGNADDGPVLLSSAFSSGDQAPPGHPRCRCAISPVVLTGPDAEQAYAELGVSA